MKAKKRFEFDPDFAIPPGETLQEVMTSLDMSQKELAVRTGLTVQSIIRIFKGEQPITYETANRLELATNVPANMWNNLEAQYREQLAKLDERRRLESDLQWLKLIPTKELIERGAIEAQQDKVLLLRETLKFYGVSSVKAWNNIWASPAVAARRSQCFDTDLGSASAWIRLGERNGHLIQCASYDKKRFLAAVERIRSLTVQSPEEFESPLVEACAGAGVALSLIREMKKVPWHGATKWLTPNKAMILLNLRGKSEDQFWFSFFHEAGHVLHDSKKDLYINDGTRTDPREQRADDFAAETLIPSRFNPQIQQIKTKAQIKTMARKLGIAPGLVVGRYQHLTEKWNWFNDLKRRFEWAK